MARWEVPRVLHCGNDTMVYLNGLKGACWKGVYMARATIHKQRRMAFKSFSDWIQLVFPFPPCPSPSLDDFPINQKLFRFIFGKAKSSSEKISPNLAKILVPPIYIHTFPAVSLPSRTLASRSLARHSLGVSLHLEGSKGSPQGDSSNVPQLSSW